jgi:hypothetical protein
MRKTTTLGVMLALSLGAAVPGAGPLRAAPDDCSAVSTWVDYLQEMRDRQDTLAQREADLSRDAALTTDELAAGLATVADEREAATAEFNAHAAPPLAESVRTAYSLAWELDGLIGNAYLRAVRTGDPRLRGLADGYTEASGTITARANQLLDQLLETCRD